MSRSIIYDDTERMARFFPSPISIPDAPANDWLADAVEPRPLHPGVHRSGGGGSPPMIRKWLVTEKRYNGSRTVYAIAHDWPPRIEKENAQRVSVRELTGDELTMTLDQLIAAERAKLLPRAVAVPTVALVEEVPIA